ncbi:MAG: hypothetical protein M1825_001850 [Sarcosagium campestre]|nr:MAG: hypothetical protein M1825_001850 [Sarcosagium campestre]
MLNFSKSSIMGDWRARLTKTPQTSVKVADPPTPDPSRQYGFGPSRGASSREKTKGKDRDSGNKEKETLGHGIPISSYRGDVTLFGSGSQANIPKTGYFGGPIFHKPSLSWTPTLYTNATGQIVGGGSTVFPEPHRILQTAVAATGSLSDGTGVFESGFWVAPNLFISALHMITWVMGHRNDVECKFFCNAGTTFYVEDEICSLLNCQESVRVELIRFDAKRDIGLFRTKTDEVRRAKKWVQVDNLLEEDEVQSTFSVGQEVLTVGFNSRFSDIETATVLGIIHMSMLGSGNVPATVSLALGVSATMWKGASGGPRVIVGGMDHGKVVGINHGHNVN